MELLQLIRQAGCDATFWGDDLTVVNGKKLPIELKKELQDRKEEVMESLRAEAEQEFRSNGFYFKSDKGVGEVLVHAARTLPHGKLVCEGGKYRIVTDGTKKADLVIAISEWLAIANTEGVENGFEVV